MAPTDYVKQGLEFIMSQANPTDVEATRYAESYIIYGDQSRAWRAAFPKAKAKPESVHSKASVMHKHVKVQSRIKELQALSKKQSEDEFELSVGRIKQMLTSAAMKGLKNKLDQQGNQVPVSIPGTVSALAEINKMDGNHAPTKHAHGGSSDMPPIETVNHDLSDTERSARIAAILNRGRDRRAGQTDK